MPMLTVVFVDASCGGFCFWKPEEAGLLFSHGKDVREGQMSLAYLQCGLCLSVPLPECWAVEKLKS